MLNEKQVFERLTDVFRDIFDDDSINISRSTVSSDIDEWDSLEHINLIAAVEGEFGMRFKMKEVSAMKNVGEMVDIILERAAK